MSVAGTRIVTSQMEESRDSRAPVRAIDFAPTALVTSAAATQLALLPLVERTISVSLGFARPKTCCANAVSHDTSFANAERMPFMETSEIADRAPSSFTASSERIRFAMLSDSGGGLMNFFHQLSNDMLGIRCATTVPASQYFSTRSIGCDQHIKCRF